MTDTVAVALISAGASALVSITALLLNYRGFTSIDNRFASIENRLSAIENESRQTNARLAGLSERIGRLEGLVGGLTERWKSWKSASRR